MTAATRRSVFVTLVMFFVTVPSFLLVLEAFSRPDINSRARHWVAALDERELARSAASISVLPSPYRRALYAALSSEAKAGVWRNQIGRYREEHPELTSRQIAYLDQISEFLVAGRLFRASGRPDSSDLETLQRLAKQAPEVLGPGGARILVALGPEDAKVTTKEPIRQRLTGWIAQKLSLNASYDICECSQDSDWCTGGKECQWPEGGCEIWGNPYPCSQPACGTFLCYTCNGMCLPRAR